MARPLKISNLMGILKAKAKCGEFILMPHAVERRLERSIALNDIVYVLTTGWHEPKKDEFHEAHSSWNYAIRGKTIDDVQVRVVVSFDENNLLVITVIRLQKR